MGETERNPLGEQLAPVGDFVKQLFAVGGVPLVLIGLGAVNMFVPYSETQRWVVSIVLIAIGTLAWAASAYIALLQWKVRAQIVAEQDSLVLKAVCDIAKSEKSDVIPGKIDALSGALKNLGVRSLPTGSPSYQSRDDA